MINKVEKNINTNNNVEDNLVSLEFLTKSKLSDAISSFWIVDSLDFYENSEYFSKLKLEKWETIFDEWDIDNNIYIIKSWDVSIEKYTSEWKDHEKQLAKLWKWDFFWEWALKWNFNKENRARVLSKTELLSIDAKRWLSLFIRNNPEQWLKLLVSIINITNSRLLDSNSQITANYEINIAINKIEEVNYHSIFWLFDKFKSIAWCDYILYFENNEVIKEIVTLRYDSRKKQKLQDKIFYKEDSWEFLVNKYKKELDIKESDYIETSKLSIWETILWYIVLWRERRIFSENDKKMIYWVSNSLTWIIKQFIVSKENRNKIYIEEM